MKDNGVKELVRGFSKQLDKVYNTLEEQKGILYFLYNPVVKQGKIIDLEESLNGHLNEHKLEKEMIEKNKANLKKEERLGKHDWRMLVFRVLLLTLGTILASELGAIIYKSLCSQ